MKIVDIRNLKPGGRVGRNLYKDKVLLLAKGYQIDDRVLETVRNHKLRNMRVYINDGELSEFVKQSGTYFVDVVERGHGSVSLDASLSVNGYVDSHSRLLVSGDLEVNEEVMPYAHISVHGKVVVHGDVYGCCLSGSERITLVNVGCAEQMPTLISLQPFTVRKMQVLRNLSVSKMQKIKPLMDKLKGPVSKVTALGQKVNMLPQETKVKLMAAYKKYREFHAEHKKLESQIEILDNRIEDASHRPRIECIGTVFPGTVIRIGDEALHITEPLAHVEFSLIDGRIQHSKIRN